MEFPYEQCSECNKLENNNCNLYKELFNGASLSDHVNSNIGVFNFVLENRRGGLPWGISQRIIEYEMNCPKKNGRRPVDQLYVIMGNDGSTSHYQKVKGIRVTPRDSNGNIIVTEDESKTRIEKCKSDLALLPSLIEKGESKEVVDSLEKMIKAIMKVQEYLQE